MINYIEYLNVPAKIAIVLVGIFFALQIIGEILEVKGKAVPEFLKIRKYFKRKKEEREILRKIPDTLKDVQKSLDDFMSHYSADNISKRNKWIEEVNRKLDENDRLIKELNEKLDKNNANTLSILIDNKRSAIIGFASVVTDENAPVTREQFNRIFKAYKEYEDIIEENKMTNGEVDIAYLIIKESYEKHMRKHTFLEEVRGYDSQ